MLGPDSTVPAADERTNEPVACEARLAVIKSTVADMLSNRERTPRLVEQRNIMARRTVGRSQRWTDRVVGRYGNGFGVRDATLWDQRTSLIPW